MGVCGGSGGYRAVLDAQKTGGDQAGGTHRNIYSLYLTAQLAAPQMAQYRATISLGRQR